MVMRMMMRRMMTRRRTLPIWPDSSTWHRSDGNPRRIHRNQSPVGHGTLDSANGGADGDPEPISEVMNLTDDRAWNHMPTVAMQLDSGRSIQPAVGDQFYKYTFIYVGPSYIN